MAVSHSKLNAGFITHEVLEMYNGQDYKNIKKPGKGLEAVVGDLCGRFHRDSFLDRELGCGKK